MRFDHELDNRLTHPEDFKGMATTDPGNIVTSTVYDNLTGKSQDFEVTLFPPRNDSNYTLIRFMTWSEYPTRDFEVARCSVLNQHTGAEVISVSFPGLAPSVSRNRNFLNQEQLTGLLSRESIEEDDSSRSSFCTIALSSIKAIYGALFKSGRGLTPFENRTVVFDLYSMGNNIGIAAMRYLQPDIVLVRELAGGEKPQKLLTLARNFAKYASEDNPIYLQHNQLLANPSSDGQLGRFARYPVCLTVSAIGIARSSIVRDIKSLPPKIDNRPTKFIYVTGTKGKIVDPVHLNRLVRYSRDTLEQPTITVGITDGTHALYNSHPKNAESVKACLDIASQM